LVSEAPILVQITNPEGMMKDKETKKEQKAEGKGKMGKKAFTKFEKKEHAGKKSAKACK
jgi:hypothetical protein